ncbi:hypothetical protein HYW20_05980 [Candidatus Woesearchaeota archaeon]|nr:hypothetical protein [Candidatus Woesearchaeota archaeon]
MFITKKYGQSKIDRCPFCRKHATSMNRQNVPVCPSHKGEILDNLKCVCSSTLEIRNGKFGIFFSCIRCGSMSLRKVLEFNAVKPKMKNEKFSQMNEKKFPIKSGKIMTVRSDDPRYFD